MSLVKRAAADARGSNVSRETFLFSVALDRIQPNPYQTRISIDPAHVLGVARSIWSLREDLPATGGLQQPPTARAVRYDASADAWLPLPREIYRHAELIADALAQPFTAVQLFFGHTRNHAFQILAHGWAHLFPDTQPPIEDGASVPGPDDRYASMPLLLAFADSETMWEHAEDENRQRKATTAIEDALSLQRAMSDFKWTQEQAATRAGISRSAAANKLRLLRLPDEIQQAVNRGDLSEVHARSLLRLADVPDDLNNLAKETIEFSWPTRMLDQRIDNRIADYKPAPDEPVPGKDRYGYNTTIQLPWPLDFGPATEGWDRLNAGHRRTAAPQGSCAGCARRIKFSGQPYPRCTLDACYTARESLWEEWQIQQQQDALRAAANPPKTLVQVFEDQRSDAHPLTPSPQSPATDGLSNIRLTNPGDVRVAPAPNSQSPIPTEKIQGRLSGQRVYWFGDHDAPDRLLDKGLCSADRCECFVLAYNRYVGTAHVRPDPAGAPNMCYGCTSNARLSARKRELEKLDSASGFTKKQAARLEAQTQRQRLADLLDEVGGVDAIWTNTFFLRRLLGTVNGTLQSNLKVELTGGSVAEIGRAIFLAVGANACSTYIHDLADYDLYKGKVDQFAGKLRTPNQPNPGDSKKTGWEAGWDDRDQAEWDKLGKVPIAELPQKCFRPRVILRFIEVVPGKEHRSELWRHYNSIENHSL